MDLIAAAAGGASLSFRMTKPWDSRIARWLVRPLRGTFVHPNHITSVGLVSGLVAAALYARGGDYADLGGVFLVVTMVLDHADGELARLTGKTSVFGHRYDRGADFSVKLCTFLGMGIGLHGGPLGRWGIACGASAGLALVCIFNARSALARRRGAAEGFRQPAFAGFEIEDILYLIAPLTWLGVLPPFVVAAGLGAPVFAAWTLLQLRRAVVADRAQPSAVHAPEGREHPPAAAPAFAASAGAVASLARPGVAVGIAVFTALVVYHGVAELGAALAVAGWGLVVVALFHLLPLVGDAMGWRSLLAPGERPPLRVFVRARWIGESVNGLLPVMQIGGNVVKAQLLTQAGVSGPLAGASVVADVTLVMLSQLFFTLVGVVLLVPRIGGQRLLVPVLLGAGLMALLAAGFLIAQRSGVFGIGARLAARLGRQLGGGTLALDADALDANVAALYRRRRRLLTAAGWHAASWIVGTGEVWLALYFLGHPVDLATAVLLESLGQAARAAAFAIPGALGVQEGGFIVLGSVLGLGPETCLALSLAKRARELLLGVPGLVAWQSTATLPALAQRAHGIEIEAVRERVS